MHIHKSMIHCWVIENEATTFIFFFQIEVTVMGTNTALLNVSTLEVYICSAI